MSFLSGLKVFGHGIEKVIGWMGSDKGQQVIGAGEAVLETALPASIPIVNLFNAWAKRVFMVESLAVAAQQSSGTGAEKAQLAISTIGPQILAYAAQEGLAPRTAEQIQAANDAVVAFIKALTDPAPTVPLGGPSATPQPVIPPINNK